MSAFDALVTIVGVAAGGVAALAGFGVGSLLTPLLATRYDAKLAVALVALPHATATLIRVWRLRHDIAWPVLRGFGIASAAGGLLGAYVFTQVAGPVLARLLAVLLIVVGSAEALGAAQRWHLAGTWAMAAGALSGLFGGMVGNQGGIRSAGLLAFDLAPKQFIATAASIALIVDAARIPVYLWDEGARIWANSSVVAFATVGAVIGTFAGTMLLKRLPPRLFRRLIGVVLLALGIWMWP